MEKVIDVVVGIFPFVILVGFVLAVAVGVVSWLIRHLRRREQEFYEQFADVGGNNS